MTIEKNGKTYFSLFWHSDEHTLHPHTPTSHILNNIDVMRKQLGVEHIDFEVWGGDLCHDNTYTSDSNYEYLQRWVRDYLFDCHQKGITVRILAGTASHDWEQPEMFELLKPKGSPLIKYVRTLSIEYIEKFNIHVLYVPDNFGNKPKTEIYNEAVELIAAHGLKKVDFIFLHGGFDFQLPPVAHKHDNLYNAEKWRFLADKIILSGHIHKPSSKYNIYSSGSFDRIAFGEMHAKGAYHVLFNQEEVFPTFIENKHAMVYDDIDLTPLDDVAEINNKIFLYLNNKNLTAGGNVRFVGGNGHAVNAVIADLKTRFPYCRFDAKNADIDQNVTHVALYEPEAFEACSLDKSHFKASLFRFIGESLPEGITLAGLENEIDDLFKENDE